MTDKGGKQLLFSVTKEDCDWQTFRSGGKGGQNQNKVSSGVRCIHRASGAVGEARDTRSQLLNRRAAFERMAQSAVFQTWLRLETARRLGQPSVDELVERAMEPQNLKFEGLVEGKWQQLSN